MNRFVNSFTLLLQPFSKYILLGICRLAIRAKGKSRKDYYTNMAQRFRLLAFRPGSREIVKRELDTALQLDIKVNVCELVGTHICAGAVFEPHEMVIVKKLVKPGDLFFDVGANIGIHSMIASRLVGEGSVYAFEPASFAYRMLLDNLLLNHIENVKAVQSVVNDQPREVDLYINSESALTSVGMTKRGTVVSTEKVHSITLDDFASKHGISKIDFLKIDVEGYEGHVLRGAEELIKESPDLVILCELAEKNYRPLNLSINEVIDWMRARNYAVWEIENQSGRLLNLKETRSKYANHNFVFVHCGSVKLAVLDELLNS